MLTELDTRQLAEDIIKIFIRTQPIGLGTFNDAVNGSTCRGSFGTSAEKSVLASYGEGTDTVFREIVGNGAIAILQIIH